jgi:hypothetical protein
MHAAQPWLLLYLRAGPCARAAWCRTPVGAPRPPFRSTHPASMKSRSCSGCDSSPVTKPCAKHTWVTNGANAPRPCAALARSSSLLSSSAAASVARIVSLPASPALSPHCSCGITTLVFRHNLTAMPAKESLVLSFHRHHEHPRHCTFGKHAARASAMDTRIASSPVLTPVHRSVRSGSTRAWIATSWG